jgi:pimeloyl-ACP methyl ester carboxylesterase
VGEPEVEHRFVQTRGLRFDVAMAGQGDRLALLLHGFPESSYAWRHQLPLLARLGYRAWAPDLRGYGKSDRPESAAQYTIDKLEQDVADLIDASGCKSVVLIGHDWGAAVAWNFAMYGVRPIERLVILNVPHPACFEQGLRTLRQLRRSWYMFFFQIPMLPERLLGAGHAALIGRIFLWGSADEARFPSDVRDVYRANALVEPGALTAMLNYYRAIPRAIGMARKRGMPMIEVPTLMLWGERDIALGKELTYGTGRFVPDLTLRYLPNAGHSIQQEAPETVNAMLEAWLTGLPVPDA